MMNALTDYEVQAIRKDICEDCEGTDFEIDDTCKKHCAAFLEAAEAVKEARNE